MPIAASSLTRTSSGESDVGARLGGSVTVVVVGARVVVVVLDVVVVDRLAVVEVLELDDT